MEIVFIYLIIYLINIVDINSQNNTLSHKNIKISFSNKYSNKTIEKYDTNLQIIENETIIDEIFINNSYIFNNYTLEFSYSGKILYLNEINLDVIYKENEYNDKYDWILLISSISILNEYISNYNKIINKITKVIIIPKGIIENIDIIANACYLELSIYLIEFDNNLFNQLIETYVYNDLSNNYFYGKIMSKKYELFSYLNLKSKAIVILILLFFITFFYFIFKDINEEEKNNCYELIYKNLGFKLIIFMLLYIDLNNFTNLKGFYNYQNSNYFSIGLFSILITKYYITKSFFFELTGVGLYIKIPLFYLIIIKLLCLSSFILYIIDYFFFSLEKSKLFFMLYILIANTILFVNIKNIIYLCRLNSKINNIREYKKYQNSIKLKIFILISQLIAFITYIYNFFYLIKYLLFKQKLYFQIEKYVLLEGLQILLFLIISILHIPLLCTFGFNHYISIKKYKNKKLKIDYNYESNIPKSTRFNFYKIIDFIKIKNQKPIVVLNPKAFFNNNKKLKDKNSISIKSKIGILKKKL